MKQYRKNNTVNKIRIIGGKWRGYKLTVINHSEVRPTTNRMRETLFNWLAPFIIRAKCLDCFAGSGALGIEALSRGASSVVFLEIKYNVAQQIQQNLDLLRATNAKVININAINFLIKPKKLYDVIFIDPPFHKHLLPKTLRLLEQKKWLTDNALVYIESEIENNILSVPTNWDLYKEKILGQVMYRLYRHVYKK